MSTQLLFHNVQNNSTSAISTNYLNYTLNNNLTYSLDGSAYPFRIGVDDNGNVGYYKGGADTVTPFSSDRIPTNIPFTTSGYEYEAESDGYIVYILGTFANNWIANVSVNGAIIDEVIGTSVMSHSGYCQIHKGDIIKPYISAVYEGYVFAQCVFIPNVYHIEQCGASGYSIQNDGTLVTLLHYFLDGGTGNILYANLGTLPIIQPMGTPGNITKGGYGINLLYTNKANQGDVITYAVGHSYNRIGNWVVW